MARARNTRLARLAASAIREEAAQASERSANAARAAICAMVSGALEQSGIDAAGVAALRIARQAWRLSRAAGRGRTDVRVDIAEGRSAAPYRSRPMEDGFDESTSGDQQGLAGLFAAKLGNIAQTYQDGRRPDLANASLAEWFAWSLVRRVGATPAIEAASRHRLPPA